MRHFQHLRCTFIAVLVCGLAACVSGNPMDRTVAADTSPPQPSRIVPLFVIPNCGAIGGTQNCQWIEPRGYKPHSETRIKAQHINGIAL
jgi:hypothetical protein